MHPISIATMGMFSGPPKRIMTEPIKTTGVEAHKFPSAEVTNIETESSTIKINVINDGDNND